MHGTHVFADLPRDNCLFFFLSVKEHSMAKEGTGSNSEATVSESQTSKDDSPPFNKCQVKKASESQTSKDDSPPFNKRQVAGLTSVMAKGLGPVFFVLQLVKTMAYSGDHPLTGRAGLLQ